LLVSGAVTPVHSQRLSVLAECDIMSGHCIRTMAMACQHAQNARVPELSSAGNKARNTICCDAARHTCSHDLKHVFSVETFSFIALLLFGTSDMHADIYGMTSADTDATAHSGTFISSCRACCVRATMLPERTLLRNQETVMPA